MSDSIQFTQAGYDKLVAELGDLKSTKRKAAVDRLARARLWVIYLKIVSIMLQKKNWHL